METGDRPTPATVPLRAGFAITFRRALIAGLLSRSQITGKTLHMKYSDIQRPPFRQEIPVPFVGWVGAVPAKRSEANRIPPGVLKSDVGFKKDGNIQQSEPQQWPQLPAQPDYRLPPDLIFYRCKSLNRAIRPALCDEIVWFLSSLLKYGRWGNC